MPTDPRWRIVLGLPLASFAMAHPAVHPKVDRKAVTVEHDDSQVKWTEGDPNDSNAQWSTVPAKNVIAVAPSSSEAENESTLLYAVDNEAKQDGAKESPLLFRSATLTDFPIPFLSQHQIKHHLFQRTSPSQSGAKPQIHVVISSGSGTGLAPAVWEQLVQPLLECVGLSKNDYTIHPTTSENSITELVQDNILPSANNGEEQVILLLSGDGGVVDIVNAILSAKHTEAYKKPTIALLPLGTGNALANSTVVANDNTMGLRTMLCGSSNSLPLFRATFSPGARLLVNEGRDEQELHSAVDGQPVAIGAVVCSWGLHATLVADSDTTEFRKFGAERFKMAANEALFPSDGSLPHAYRGRVSIRRVGNDGWEDVPRDEHGYVLVTLVSNLEAGFTISPSSRPLDGKLRLVHFGHVSGQEAMEIMKEAYQGGKHVEDERLGYEEISGLKVHFDEDEGRWRRVCIDGKIIKVEKGGYIEVEIEAEKVVDLIARRD